MFRVVESLANQDAHLVNRTAGGHLAQLLYLVHTRIDEPLTILMRIDHPLVEDSIRQVIDQNLDADVGGAWILRLRFTCRILPFPLRLTQPVRLVPLLDVCEDVVDGFLDRSLADTHGGNQYVHEGRLVLHIVPIAEFDPMQVGA